MKKLKKEYKNISSFLRDSIFLFLIWILLENFLYAQTLIYKHFANVLDHPTIYSLYYHENTLISSGEGGIGEWDGKTFRKWNWLHSKLPHTFITKLTYSSSSRYFYAIVYRYGLIQIDTNHKQIFTILKAPIANAQTIGPIFINENRLYLLEPFKLIRTFSSPVRSACECQNGNVYLIADDTLYKITPSNPQLFPLTTPNLDSISRVHCLKDTFFIRNHNKIFFPGKNDTIDIQPNWMFFENKCSNEIFGIDSNYRLYSIHPQNGKRFIGDISFLKEHQISSLLYNCESGFWIGTTTKGIFWIPHHSFHIIHQGQNWYAIAKDSLGIFNPLIAQNRTEKLYPKLPFLIFPRYLTRLFRRKPYFFELGITKKQVLYFFSSSLDSLTLDSNFVNKRINDVTLTPFPMIATDEGAYFLHNNKWNPIPKLQNIPVETFAYDSLHQRWWFATYKGLFFWTNDSLHLLIPDKCNDLLLNPPFLWVASRHYLIAVDITQNTPIFYLFPLSDFIENNELLCLFQDQDSLYIGTTYGLIRFLLNRPVSISHYSIAFRNSRLYHNESISFSIQTPLFYKSIPLTLHYQIDQRLSSFCLNHVTLKPLSPGVHTLSTFIAGPFYKSNPLHISFQVFFDISFYLILIFFLEMSFWAYQFTPTLLHRLSRWWLARKIRQQKAFHLLKYQLTAMQIPTHTLANLFTHFQMEILEGNHKDIYNLAFYLGHYYRLLLEHSQALTVSLKDSIELIQTYLILEQKRLPSFDFSIQCDADLTIQIPSLILLPLVENAMEHGIRPLKSGKISITIQQHEHNLVITIQNPVPHRKKPKSRAFKGNGLRLVQERLVAYHPESFLVILKEYPDFVVQVYVIL